jgi:hypothetical protein
LLAELSPKHTGLSRAHDVPNPWPGYGKPVIRRIEVYEALKPVARSRGVDAVVECWFVAVGKK